jgi:muramoyltetrapeptide carboxypeptidase
VRSVVKPRPLRVGGTIGIAAPGFAVDCDRLEQGIGWLRSAGFSVRFREDVRSSCGYLAGDDERRASELMELASDPEVDAILCARGGYGCQRLIPRLDAQVFLEARKPLLGYSDVTALHLWLLRSVGLCGFHAPMLEHGAWDATETKAVVRLLGGAADEVELPGEGRASGCAEGRLVGGSLTMLAGSLGTPFEVETEGAILLFEEVCEKPYALDRLLNQLRGAGKLDGLAGVGVGHLVDCVDPKRERPTAEEVILDELLPLGVPVVVDLPFGHGRPNLPWPVGARAALDGDKGILAVLEAGVET